jgi:hypothetical protein
MPSRTLPGLGLKGDWDLGEDGWKDEMDLNILFLSVIAGQQVDQKVAAEPGAPAEGDIVILDETHATQANKIAVYDEAGWKYLVVLEGTVMYNLADDRRYEFNGAKWAVMANATAVVATDADDYTLLPDDNGKYIRLTDAAAKDINIQEEATTALPANGEWHFRNDGAGDATVVPAGAVVVNIPYGGTLIIPEGGTATIKRVAADEFDLIGVTVPA